MGLKLLAGAPNDANRDYVPQGIKGTDMTVNENGNNSQVYPARLQECTGVLADGLEDVWYEYVPESYDGSKRVPLVVSNHGGQMNGWAQAVYSSWTMLAEKEGFICVFPNAHSLMMWTIQGMADRVRANPNLVLPIPMDPEDFHDNHDLNFLRALIDHMQKKYRIDASRIYMQGMSMGHMMTDQFARYYGDILAGAAGSGASAFATQLYTADGALRNWGGPVPTWISHPEKNGMDGPMGDEEAAQRTGRTYWAKVNGVHGRPQIRIVGEDNFAFYAGDKADMVYLDIKNRDHGQALDEAFYYWNYMFSGVHREPDGPLVKDNGLGARGGHILPGPDPGVLQRVAAQRGCPDARRSHVVAEAEVPRPGGRPDGAGGVPVRQSAVFGAGVRRGLRHRRGRSGGDGPVPGWQGGEVLPGDHWLPGGRQSARHVLRDPPPRWGAAGQRGVVLPLPVPSARLCVQ